MPRILIVEHKDSLRAMLEEMLRAEKLEVRGLGVGVAFSSKTALPLVPVAIGPTIYRKI